MDPFLVKKKKNGFPTLNRQSRHKITTINRCKLVGPVDAEGEGVRLEAVGVEEGGQQTFPHRRCLVRTVVHLQ